MLRSLSTIVLLGIVLIVMTPIGGTASDSPETTPNPIASLLPFVLMGLVIYFIVRRTRRNKHPELTEVHRQRSPTDRQMDYIDRLMEEREIETWMLEKEPETIQEASELIEKLLKRPIRDPGPM